jgi:predicted nicotinamide N-methyase
MIALFSASVATKLLPHGVPSNFWLLRTPGIASADEDALVGAYVASLNAGDADGAARGLAALTARPIAVEFEPPEPAAAPSRVALSDGAVAEEIGSPHRTFLLPGARLATVDELDYGDGGLGARVWDASIGLSIWLCQQSAGALEGKAVLSLGSGCGLDGIAAALAGAEAVALTEVALEAADDAAARRESGEFGGGALLENLASNAARSGVGAAATVSALDWVDALDANFAPAARYDLVVGADLVHDEKYSLNALAAAVSAHTARGGVAHLMCAAGRPGLERLPDALLRHGGAVERAQFCVMSSYGAADVELVSWRPG